MAVTFAAIGLMKRIYADENALRSGGYHLLKKKVLRTPSRFSARLQLFIPMPASNSLPTFNCRTTSQSRKSASLAALATRDLSTVFVGILIPWRNLFQHRVQAVPSTRSRPEILSIRLDRVSVRSVRSHRGQGSRISRISLSAFVHCTAE